MLLKTYIPLSYQIIKLYNYIVYVSMWSLVTVMHNCGIQLIRGAMKHCSSHTCSCLLYMWPSDITVVSLHQHYNTYSAWFLDIRIYQLVKLTIFKSGACPSGFLKLSLSATSVCVCVCPCACVRACVSAPKAINYI